MFRARRSPETQNTTPAAKFALGCHFAQPCQCDSYKTTPLSATTIDRRSQVHMAQSATPATRNEATSLLTRPDNNALCSFYHRHGNFPPQQSQSHMSQSATPATRNEATHHLEHPKITPFATFLIGTATFCHDGRPRTVEDG